MPCNQMQGEIWSSGEIVMSRKHKLARKTHHITTVSNADLFLAPLVGREGRQRATLPDVGFIECSISGKVHFKALVHFRVSNEEQKDFKSLFSPPAPGENCGVGSCLPLHKRRRRICRQMISPPQPNAAQTSDQIPSRFHRLSRSLRDS